MSKNINKERLTFTVLIGPPMVGKTTWRIKNGVPGAVVLSLDDIMLELAKEQYGVENDYDWAYDNVNVKDIKRLFNERFDQAIKDRQHIICDRVNLTSKTRRKVMARLPRDYQKIAVVFNWDDRELLEKRNQHRKATENKYLPPHVLQAMFDNWQPIRDEEGFDKVTYVK